MPGSQRTVQAPMPHGIPVFVKKLDITIMFFSLWNLFWTESIKVRSCRYEMVLYVVWPCLRFITQHVKESRLSLAGTYCSSCSKRTCCRQGLFWMFMSFLEECPEGIQLCNWQVWPWPLLVLPALLALLQLARLRRRWRRGGDEFGNNLDDHPLSSGVLDLQVDKDHPKWKEMTWSSAATKRNWPMLLWPAGYL